MAYSIDGTDIVINGWESGISDNPYKGINDMRGVNIVSVPGEISIGFAQTNDTFQPLALTVTAVDTTTDILTCTIQSGALSLNGNGQAVYFLGSSLPSPLQTGNTHTYWITASDPTHFVVFSDPFLNNQVDFTTTGSGSITAASFDMGEIRYFERNNPYCVDTNCRVWYQNSNNYGGNHWVYLGNKVETVSANDPTNGNGICMYTAKNGNKFLFVFRNAGIDYLNLQTGVWVPEWDPSTGATNPTVAVLNTAKAVNNPHEAIVGLYRWMYICDGSYIYAIKETDGQTFDPTNTATYTYIPKILALPPQETAQCLEILTNYLLIGGVNNFVYTWNQNPISSTNPGTGYSFVQISENGIYKLVTVNTNTFIFAGKRGRVYITNTSQAQFYTKIPDHLSGSVEPIFTWRYAAYNKNQLYMGLTATNNAGSSTSSYTGLWAIDVTTNALRTPILLSNTTADVTAIYANPSTTSGFSLNVAWKSGSTYGIDSATNLPYTAYGPYIVTDLIPVGKFLTKRTFTNVEFKLSSPLVSGEGIKISGRSSLTSGWTLIGENTIAGTTSDAFLLTLEMGVWLQLKVEFKSTNTTPSYCRLFELRLR